MPSHYTVKEIDDFLLSKGYKRLDSFVNLNKKMRLERIRDGYIWNVDIKYLKQKEKEGWREGFSRSSLTNEIIDSRIKSCGLLLERCGDYTAKEKTTWHCLNSDCPVIGGNIWKSKATRITNENYGCPACGIEKVKQHNKSSRLTQDNILKLIKNRPIILLDQYQGVSKKVNWECKLCHHIFYSKPADVIYSKTNCPKCNTGKPKITLAELENRLKGRTDIVLTGEFKGMQVKTEWICVINNHLFYNTPNNITKSGSGCPHCINKNEAYIGNLLIKYLKSMELFEHHKFYKTFNKGNGGHVDYYFKIQNKEFIVEYQGEGHYMPLNRGQGELRAKQGFEYQKTKDEMRRNYCKENNIFLLEIPYWLTEIEIINMLNMINSEKWDLIPPVVIPDKLPRGPRSARRIKENLESVVNV